MARYIDADKAMEEINRIGGHNLCEWETIGVKALIDRQPTADVVPKSKVVKALNEVELLIIITKEMYKQQMENAPNELSKQSRRTKWVAFEKFYEQFAELKKKYTEGNHV